MAWCRCSRWQPSFHRANREDDIGMGPRSGGTIDRRGGPAEQPGVKPFCGGRIDREKVVPIEADSNPPHSASKVSLFFGLIRAQPSYGTS